MAMSWVCSRNSTAVRFLLFLLDHEHCGRELRRFLARMLQAITVVGILAGVLIPPRAWPEDSPGDDDRVSIELATMGKRGARIARVREQTLTILRTESGCADWFERSNPQAADIFQSLHYEVVESESASTFHQQDGYGAELWKNPWAAMSFEDGGRNSTIRLNTNGAFFRGISPVVEMGPRRWLQPLVSRRTLRVAWFSGDTLQAQITILLHELGHVIGRIPEDSDSWDGRSAENTTEVLRHCRDQIRTVAKNKVRDSD
jgi:hypothetical protein